MPFEVRILHGNAPFRTKTEEMVTKRNIAEFLARVLREGRDQRAVQGVE